MKTKTQTILAVDDTEANIDILIGILDEYDVAVATDGPSALEIANEEDISLILLDIMMEGMDGYEVCEKLKANPKTKDIPIIFITSMSDEASIEKAYDVGGIDYVTKPFKPKELLARVRTQLKMQKLIHNLEYMASYDSMTGIYNRRKFFELSQKLLDEIQSHCAVMIDIDNFKLINDKYGHHVGDEVIKTIVDSISSSISSDAIFGRVGGEEFAILCSEYNTDIVMEEIENIRKGIEALHVLSDKKEVIKFTISSGIAQRNAEYKSLDRLLKRADDALYEAKKGGRNRSVIRKED